MNETIYLVALLLYAVLATVLLGRSTTILSKSSVIRMISIRIMDYTAYDLDVIRLHVIWAAYILLGIGASAIIWLVFAQTIIPYFDFGTAIETLKYAFVSFIVQLELTSVVLTLLSTLQPQFHWFEIFSSITWIELSYHLSRGERALYVLSAAFVEEVFFRCTLFIVLFSGFDCIPFWLKVALVTALFVVEQILCTKGFRQGLAIGIASIAVSLSNCIAICCVGNVWPAIISHMIYVVFYMI